MTNLRDLFNDVVDTPPPSRHTAASIYATGRQRRLLTSATRVAAAALAVALAGGAAYATARTSGPVSSTANGTLTSIAALGIDGDRMSATLRDCPNPGSPDPTGQPGHPSGIPAPSGQPAGKPGASTQPGNPAGKPAASGKPGASGQPAGPSGNPGASGQPGNPSGKPGASAQSGNQPAAYAQPGSPSGKPGASAQPGNPSGRPGASAQPGNPSGGPGASGQPANPGGQAFSAPPSPRYTPPCQFRHLVSTDGGRTWQEGQRDAGPEWTEPLIGMFGMSLSSGVATGTAAGAGQVLSANGVAIARIVTPASGSISQVPAHGWATTLASSDPATSVAGSLYGVDPATGTAVALANQPLLVTDGWMVPVGPNGMITVTGVAAGDSRPSAAVSRDRGRTWSTHRLPETDWQTTPDVYSGDGVHVYALSGYVRGAGCQYFASADGGATWGPRQTVPGVACAARYTTRDGALVLGVADTDNATSYWVSRDNGTSVQRLPNLTGLPSNFTPNLRQLEDGSYVAAPRDLPSTAFYRSTDGW
ncbi:MAG: hypothetical protein QOE03_3434, partial [Micromonosporaceae bacterium]|nr:hypothetical protein [Micromonosporaceae bacterium]